MSQRLEKLRSALQEQRLDAIIVESSANRRYISGFTGSTGWAIVSLAKAVFVTDFRYVEQAQTQCPAFTVVDNKRQAIPAIAGQLQAMGVKKLGFEKQYTSYGTFESWTNAFAGVELVPVGGMVEKLRMYKDKGELETVREATRIADAAFEHILAFIKPGVREVDVALELEVFMRKQGATSSSFDTIVASGVRGALPHGHASDKVIAAGELVTMDYGALYQGYCSDITRTVAVGEPSDQLKEIYDIVLRAQLAGVTGIRPGMTGKEADALTRDIIVQAGYGDAYGHSAGHSFGLEVHEAPNLSMSSDAVLEPGMLVTVEPGIYLSGIGGVRIEDDVFITETGCEILTKSTKELLILPV